ncbi:MAG: hypothetical protein KA143_07470 [Saprospiraceae bacterium]|nr:hypothetical protein [Saprospiraceae bacterium]
MIYLFLILSIHFTSVSHIGHDLNSVLDNPADTLFIPARELDSLYISVKDGKWIKEGPVTKVSKKYGGTPPFIPEVTKCYPCDTLPGRIRD